jgi:hypothetical protein
VSSREGKDFLAAEYVVAAGEPRDATAYRYRSRHQPVPSFVLRSAGMTVKLLDDPGRGHFTFECLVEPNGELTATGLEFASEEWSYDIPAGEGDLSEVRAWDDAGTLQTQLGHPDGKTTRLRIRFRRLVRTGAPYLFWYSYEGPVRSVVCSGVLTRTVMCAGWLIFNLHCAALRVSIEIPARARVLRSVPWGDAGSGFPDRVRFRVDHLRALESSHWLMAYQRRACGLPMYVWAGSQMVAGIIGWMIGRALDGWMAGG